MTQDRIKRRVAMARLEAALIRIGLSNHADVTVRVGHDDNPEDVRKALEEFCSLPDAAGVKRGSNRVHLAGLYGDPSKSTHAVAPAEVVDVPIGITEVLSRLRDSLPRKDASVDHSKVGWRLSVDRDTKPSAGIILHITTPKAINHSFKIESHASNFSRALDVPVRLEIGQYARQQDAWAQRAHNTIATGMGIGNGINAATVTLPVRLRENQGDAAPSGARTYHFVTAAHAFFHNGKSRGVGSKVYQPNSNTNPNRVIGTLVDCDYDKSQNSVNFFDAAVVDSTQTISFALGKDDRILRGIWDKELQGDERVYIYGASTGFQPVHIECFLDVSVAMLTGEGNKLIYKDMIEFSRDGDDTKPATASGDSGGALLVRTGDEYWVVGMIVGGGTQVAKARKPRSYAVPIMRILDRFNLETF